ncbi:MAG TPA: YkgJ family cysteine cluster protein [bacterium]|nr:YkgJ family cysteine cluster protein [bacterium]
MTKLEKQTLEKLRALHERVDRQAATIVARLGARLRCGPGCSDCCQDELTVFDIEAMRICEEFPQVVTKGEPAPAGRCAFLDEAGQCRVYNARPYVCRTQGLPLRWLEENEMGWVEFRDICPLNDQGDPLETLPAEDCFLLGPTEDRLRELQRSLTGDLSRIALRELFRRS